MGSSATGRGRTRSSSSTVSRSPRRRIDYRGVVVEEMEVLPHSEITGLKRLRERPLVDRLVELLPDVELHVVGPPRSRG